jgi:DNA-binding Xre family transcriptional regulator
MDHNIITLPTGSVEIAPDGDGRRRFRCPPGEPPPIARNLRLIREQKGISLMDLGSRAGISYQHVQKIERGDIREPTIGTLKKLADALGVKLGNLIKAYG